MEDYLTTSFNRHISCHNGEMIEDIGLELHCTFEGTEVFLCFVVAATDYELIPEILPEERFESGSVHVSELHQHTDIDDEIESILSNANHGDTLIFFCESAEVIAFALDTLAYSDN
ncbi:MAG: hypothetical protein Q4G44_00810 [Alcaligenaceae bacterium]|nr:hypothetical protein [Alcaligenaceae bacterium]